MSSDTLTGQIRDRLTAVLDPCSCFTDNPVSIVELGIVECITVSDGMAEIELLLTSPGCTYMPYIERDIEERVLDVEGIHSVEVRQITDEIWTEERMADDVQTARRERFQNQMESAGITPHGEFSG